jgi:hypothetical protein
MIIKSLRPVAQITFLEVGEFSSFAIFVYWHSSVSMKIYLTNVTR